MSENTNITVQMIRDIINGKMNTEQTNRKIRELESQYGTDFFLDYEIDKKDKPWDEAYLYELELKSMTGMSSKPFILHLAEVSEYVHAQKSGKSGSESSSSDNKGSKKIIRIIAMIAAFFAVVAIAAAALNNKESKSNSVSVNNAASQTVEEIDPEFLI